MNGIVDQLQDAAEGKSPFKLSLFSFHDLNLLSVLRAIGVRGKPTEPLSALAFELWKRRESPNSGRFKVLLRMSEGLTTDWIYQADEYVPIYDGRYAKRRQLTELADVAKVMRTFYADKVNTTNCGYFGRDAKV